MLGKLRINDGETITMTSLLKLGEISHYYQNESISDELKNFLDLCFYDSHISLNDISRHELVIDYIIVSESSKRNLTYRNTLFENSSKLSGTTNTSKILKRYLTSGTHEEGSSSEYNSDVTSLMNGAIDTFKRKQKIQSVMYEDNSFILKQLMSNAQRKSKFKSPSQKMSGGSLGNFLNPGTVGETSSVSSSSPGSVSRKLTTLRQVVIASDARTTNKAGPIYEEILEEEVEKSKQSYC